MRKKGMAMKTVGSLIILVVLLLFFTGPIKDMVMTISQKAMDFADNLMPNPADDNPDTYGACCTSKSCVCVDVQVSEDQTDTSLDYKNRFFTDPFVGQKFKLDVHEIKLTFNQPVDSSKVSAETVNVYSDDAWIGTPDKPGDWEIYSFSGSQTLQGNVFTISKFPKGMILIELPAGYVTNDQKTFNTQQRYISFKVN